MRRLGIRARIVAVTTALLAVALLLGALALAASVWHTERAGSDDRMRAVATEVSTLIEENRLPATLPVSGTRFVQVVDRHDAVVSASVSADRLAALLSPTEIAQARTSPVEVDASRIAGPGRMRVIAVDAGAQSRRLTVLVASPVDPPSVSQRGLWLGLAAGVPLLLVLGAGLLWRAVGAALAPVDRLRSGAERIGTGEERLPVPGPTDEIQALALTLNGMLDRLDAASAAQRRFVADAAHELRSPVASLRMQVEVAERLGEGGDLPAELAPDIERLGRLVDDLLVLARAGAPAAHRPETLDLLDVVGSVAGRYGGARVPVVVTADAPVSLDADRGTVERAVTNLVDNAVRHARTRVELVVRGGDIPGAGVIEVLDDGAGIAAAHRDRVFERFTRLDDARSRDAGGSGLGLPIVRELVRLDGGEVSLHDRPDGAPGLLARLVYPPSPKSP